ncbi:DUF3918 family protein [Metabacillus fastidiosus]|uniref:DUF3918 family protein n=1 Tax=Metabacillus fastidiosus TaxID=1458 RepID=A0ABU6NV58_9BACI|nr:DUF3918 family protein [Metabacillus fastidiosus]MEC2076729.1 DUF3918 family protein [Metabacillus fastidiosus]MED4401032.1 DUF3918 family protein [Metabacillus fastidiosus]MED4453390.1 DUF3918 family protein [Metabacillus fastidiosus]MED4463958.1 DUF3918 family protein [Metabacillus fastidiosus]MED4530816.1 DUF3918 family protein [Metabacillus fastidiosus]
MRRTITSLAAVGLGAAAYYYSRNNRTANRGMKRMTKRMTNIFS